MPADLDTEIPEALTMEVAGHPVTVTYRRNHSYHSLVATISFPPPLLKHFDLIDAIQLHEDAWRDGTTYIIVDADGTEIASTEWHWDIEKAYQCALARRSRGETLAGLQVELEELKAEAESLRPRGLYWSGLTEAFLVCDYQLQNGDNLDVARVKELLGHVCKLLARLGGPFVDVVVSCLIDDTLFHPNVYHNNRTVRARLVELYIRSGGLVDVPDDTEMARIYRRRLTEVGVKNLEQVKATDLTIELSDYFDPETYEGVEFAPESISATTTKGTTTYPVHYRLVEVDGDIVPRGIVQLPLSVYEKLRQPLEQLPHDIELYLELTVQQGRDVSVVLKGQEGGQILGRINQYRSAKRRSRSAPSVSRHAPVPGGKVPSWCVSKRPGRWR
jgi:hypothetical protein